jgi:hypothetical protein
MEDTAKGRAAESWKNAAHTWTKPSQLILVAADCRLLKARVLTDLASADKATMKERDSLLDWVLLHPAEVVSAAHRERARVLRSLGFISAEDKRAAILAVMQAERGANPAAHLFECPNGHEYWVGECGGAMEQSRCVECGLGIGGSNHVLARGNRQAAAAGAFS